MKMYILYILMGNNNLSQFLNDLLIISQLIQNFNTWLLKELLLQVVRGT